MKIAAINGSPRGEVSNTAVMLSALLEGFRDHGAEIVTITLGKKNIGQCRGCYSCWQASPGECIQQDDMASVISALKGAEVIILGTPLYFNNLSGTIKTFIDRLTAAGGDPHNAGDMATHTRYIMVSNCGFPSREQFSVLSVWIRHFCQLTQGSLLAEFYTPQGRLLTSGEKTCREATENYLRYLRGCGEELARDGKLSGESQAKLQRSIADF